MKIPSLAEMPDPARLWVFAAPHPLSEREAEHLLARVDAFLREWHAHGHPVVGARDWRYDRFLFIAADEEATGVSGCSLDALFRVFKQLEREMGLSLRESAARVWYRDAAGAIQSSSRAEFRERVERGEIGPDALVFDNTVATVGALRAGKWERPMQESWHARAFAPGGLRL